MCVYICVCVYIYVCMYVCMCVCFKYTLNHSYPLLTQLK